MHNISHNPVRTVGLLTAFFICSATLSAAEPTYWQDVRPILRKHCTVCHSEKNLKERDVSGGLALDSYTSVLKGRDMPILKAGAGAQSTLVRVLRHPDKDRRMPLDGQPLSDDAVALIKAWVDAGVKEGTRPTEVATVASMGGPPARRRYLDVVLPTRLQKPPRLELALPVGPLAPVAAVAYSPDGAWLAVGSYGRVTVWDPKTARPAKIITNVLGAVNDLKFSPDGSLLAVGGGQPSARGDLRLFRTKDWSLLAHHGDHADVVACLAFSPDGKTLASASFDKTVRLWDLTTQKVKLSLMGHSDFVYSVAFSPKGDWLVTASKDRTVRLVEIATGNGRLTFSGMEQDVLAVAVTPDGTQVVSSGYESALFWWNPQTAERTRRQSGHDVAVHELAFDRSGKMLASAGGDKTVRLWNGASGEAIRTLPAGSMVYAIAIRPDGQQVAGGCFDGSVKVWETTGGRLLLTLVSADAADWLALTPEGFVSANDALVGRARWLSAGQPQLAESVWPALRQPSQVVRAWLGEKITEPALPMPRR